MCGIAGIIMSVSWYAFTWAITHGEVLAASLGYFINPLFAIALAMFFLKERLTQSTSYCCYFGYFRHWLSGMAIRPITLAFFNYGQVFCCLWFNKKIHQILSALTSVMIEAAVMTPFALIYMIWLYLSGDSVALTSGTTTFLLYAGATPVTVAPLIFLP